MRKFASLVALAALLSGRCRRRAQMDPDNPTCPAGAELVDLPPDALHAADRERPSRAARRRLDRRQSDSATGSGAARREHRGNLAALARRQCRGRQPGRPADPPVRASDPDPAGLDLLFGLQFPVHGRHRPLRRQWRRLHGAHVHPHRRPPGDPRRSSLRATIRSDLIGEIEQQSALLASADNDFLIRMGVSRLLLTEVMYRQNAVRAPPTARPAAA